MLPLLFKVLILEGVADLREEHRSIADFRCLGRYLASLQHPKQLGFEEAIPAL